VEIYFKTGILMVKGTFSTKLKDEIKIIEKLRKINISKENRRNSKILMESQI
jgi:hypothetical protein